MLQLVLACLQRVAKTHSSTLDRNFDTPSAIIVNIVAVISDLGHLTTHSKIDIIIASSSSAAAKLISHLI